MSKTKLGRREFLKLSSGSTAALVLGFQWGFISSGCAREFEDSFTPNAYLSISTDDTVTVVMPRSEMGQKIYTSLPMILAEELDADWRKIRVVQGDLDSVFGSQSTGGSASIRTQYDLLRKAGATARAMLVTAAAQIWSLPENQCYASEGKVYNNINNNSLRYGQLVKTAQSLDVPVQVPLKDPKDFKIIGQAYQSLDGLPKVDGSLKYGYDFNLPGLLTAVIARIPAYGASLKSYAAEQALQVPGVVTVVPVSAGLAVVARDTHAALLGREKLSIQWEPGKYQNLNSSDLLKRFKKSLTQAGVTIENIGDIHKAKGQAINRLDLTFEVPYLDHAPQEPNNCTAYIHNGRCEIWAPTQNPANGFKAAKSITGFSDDKIVIHTLRMGGGFGRRLQADYVTDAVEVAMQVEKPVKVVRMRPEDLKNGTYRPASMHRIQVGWDRQGTPLFWDHRIVGPTTGWHGMYTGGATDLAYAIPHQEIAYSMVDSPVPIGAWRSVANTQTAFVNECALDEVARRTGQDPVALRLGLMKRHPRHMGVLNLAAEKAGWGKSLPGGHAQGVAVHKSFQSYVAIVAEVSQKAEGGIRVEKITAAIDCGTVINPDGVRSQVEGGVVMALTAALYGEISIKNGAVQQSNFHDYPLLRMSEMPVIETHIVESKERPTGAGEPPVPPTPPALLNAIAALTGKRITTLPLKNHNF